MAHAQGFCSAQAVQMHVIWELEGTQVGKDLVITKWSDPDSEAIYYCWLKYQKVVNVRITEDLSEIEKDRKENL